MPPNIIYRKMADKGLARPNPPKTADKKKKKKPKSRGEPGDSKPMPRHDCFQSHMAGVKHLYTPPILARKHTSSSLVAELEQLAEAGDSKPMPRLKRRSSRLEPAGGKRCVAWH